MTIQDLLEQGVIIQYAKDFGVITLDDELNSIVLYEDNNDELFFQEDSEWANREIRYIYANCIGNLIIEVE